MFHQSLLHIRVFSDPDLYIQHGWISNCCNSKNISKYFKSASSLALNGGGRIFFLPVLSLIFPACSLVLSRLIYWETLSALLFKLKNDGFDQLVSQRNWHHLLDEKRRYLPIRNHDNRSSADWIRLCPGLSKNSENRNSCPKPHKAARHDWSSGKSGQHWDWDY